MTRFLVVAWAYMAAGVLGCGAKTGMRIPAPPPHDASVDARPRDAGFDAGPPMLDSGPEPEVCVELPYAEPPREISVSFDGRIVAADVLFLVDTTGSMGSEIDQIRAGLRDVIVPALVEAVPDVRLSVAYHADFPEESYGSPDDVVFRLLQGSTNDLAAAQSAVERLPNLNGGDGPESQVEALYLAATGMGLGTYVSPARCPAGTIGYPCFRGDGSRIFLLFTDATFHNGPGGVEPYLGLRTRTHTYDEAVSALRGIGAKVLGLFSGDGDFAALSHLQSIARDTGAVDESGRPIVFDIGGDGRQLDTGVIETVRTLVEEAPMDVDIVAEDVDGDAVDATLFVTRVIAESADPPDGATNRGDRFDDVRPGTRVTFVIELANDLLPAREDPQYYLLRVVLRGDGVTRLQETVVYIVVPGLSGGGCEDVVRS